MQTFGVLEILMTIGISVSGWFLRMLWDNDRALEKRVHDHHMDASEKFVRKDDYRVDIREVRQMLDKIFNKLDEKADKP